MAAGHLLLGVGAAAGAATCFDGAVILQAAEARTMAASHALRLSLLRELARRRRWLAGTALAVAGWPLQLAAYALAPVTVVQPTLAFGFVLLLVAGSRILGERVGPGAWAAAAGVVTGVALLAIAAPAHTQHVPSSAAMAVVCAGLGLVAVAPFLVSPWRAVAPALILAAGAAFALAALTSKMLTVALAAGQPGAAVAWAALTAAGAAMGFLIDNTAMQQFPATRVAPPMFVLETAIPVALAPFLFEERWRPTPGGGTVLVLGLALVLGGGALLAAADVEHEIRGSGERSVAGVGPAR